MIMLQIMGQVNLAPLFGDIWNNYIPILVIIIVVSTLFNLYGRLMKMLGVDAYALFQGGKDENDMYDVEDGQVMI